MMQVAPTALKLGARLQSADGLDQRARRGRDSGRGSSLRSSLLGRWSCPHWRSRVSLLYVAGMFLNDAFDCALRCPSSRAERPIPARGGARFGRDRCSSVGFGAAGGGLWSRCRYRLRRGRRSSHLSLRRRARGSDRALRRVAQGKPIEPDSSWAFAGSLVYFTAALARFGTTRLSRAPRRWRAARVPRGSHLRGEAGELGGGPQPVAAPLSLSPLRRHCEGFGPGTADGFALPHLAGVGIAMTVWGAADQGASRRTPRVVVRLTLTGILPLRGADGLPRRGRPDAASDRSWRQDRDRGDADRL